MGLLAKKDNESFAYLTGWVAFVGVLVSAIRAGIGMQTLGFIVTPMEEEMGWSSSSITLCITLQLIVAAIIGPKVGKILDGVGAGKILTAGLIANGLMLILISMIQQLWQLAAVMIVLGGIAQACIGNSLIMPFITKWFRKRRGFLMGLVSSGANFGSIALGPLIVFLMGDQANWRNAWLIIGLLPILIIAPVVFFVLHKAEKNQPNHHKDSDEKAIEKEGDKKELFFTVKEVLKSRIFWLIIIAWNLIDFAMKGALLNKIPYALEMGFSNSDAAGILATYSALAIVGKLAVGWFSDRIPLYIIGLILSALQACGLFFFIEASDATTLYIAYGILSGLSAGGLIALMPIILANYFGSKFQGSISGITLGLLLFSSLGGPLSASLIKDFTGSYQNGFILYTALSALAVVLFFFIRQPNSKTEN